DEFEALMHKRFQMSSMGELTFLLGLQVKQNEEGIFISHDKYVAELLKKFDFSFVKTASTPIETYKPLMKDEEAADVDVHLYRSMIGSLLYLTSSRPKIMFTVCACSRFQVTPKLSHLHAVKRIFRYLKGQPKLGLWYPRDSPFDLEAFRIVIMLELILTGNPQQEPHHHDAATTTATPPAPPLQPPKRARFAGFLSAHHKGAFGFLGFLFMGLNSKGCLFGVVSSKGGSIFCSRHKVRDGYNGGGSGVTRWLRMWGSRGGDGGCDVVVAGGRETLAGKDFRRRRPEMGVVTATGGGRPVGEEDGVMLRGNHFYVTIKDQKSKSPVREKSKVLVCIQPTASTRMYRDLSPRTSGPK
nr:uncharacterized mitochondrial protein AtMg00810-like [Tanacetum cinerariifolium]